MPTSAGAWITAARSRRRPSFCAGHRAEIRERIAEIAEADRVGDPSLLWDRGVAGERVAIDTYRDALAALALIREAVEDCAPPGSIAREGYVSREFTAQAKALVRGIHAIASRSPREPS